MTLSHLTAEQARKLNSYDPTLSSIPQGAGIVAFLNGLVDGINTAQAAADAAAAEANAEGVQLVGATALASTAITGTQEAATAFDQKVTVPANAIVAGSVLIIKAMGIYTATTGTETHTLALKIGAIVLNVTGNLDPANNDVFEYDVEVYVRANGDLAVTGWFTSGPPLTGTSKAIGAIVTPGPTLTVANDVTVEIDRQGTATDSDSARLDYLSVKKIYRAGA